MGLFGRGEGFGKVKPVTVFNGGDPTGLVRGIKWATWGTPEATGTGISEYVAPNQITAAGKEEPARIVAFDLGTCSGKYAYGAVEWYFPQHAESFSVRTFEDICIGAYYPPEGQYNDGKQGAQHYMVSLSGYPPKFRGSVDFVDTTGETNKIFGFTATAAVGGALTIHSVGPFDTGQTYMGTWSSSGVTLKDCGSYLSLPSGRVSSAFLD